MKTLGTPFLRLALKGICGLAVPLTLAAPAVAGVVDGARTVDGLTVYLGVVPAAVTRAHPPGHTERTMHGGIAKPGMHDVHLLVAVFNQGGQFFAIDDVCPHMGASLAGGHVENGVVTCPWHAWRFRLNDGTWADSPRLKIGCYAVKVEAEEVFVEV